MTIPDAGPSGVTGDGSPIGCQGKIDFLFVISYEGVMKDTQPRQTEALPKFIATIQTKFADFDYHIMAIDTDPAWGQGFCNEECPETNKCQWVADYPCDKLDLVGQCDRMLGAGNVFAADLAETFQCIAQMAAEAMA